MSILLCVLCTLAHVPSLQLRYAPFRHKVTDKQKKQLLGIYIVALVLDFIFCLAVEFTVGITVRFYKLNLLLFCALLSACNAMIIRKRMREHLFVFGIVGIIVLMLLSAMACCVDWLPLPDFRAKLCAESLLMLVAFAALYVPCNRLLCSTVTPFLEYDRKGYWGNIWFIPIAMMLATFLSIPLNAYISTVPQVLSRLLIGAATLFMCRSVAYDYKQFQEKEILGQQLRLEKQYYDELSQKVVEARKARHDLKHHLAAIQSFVDTGNKEKLQAYCAQLEYDQTVAEWIPYSGNLAADGILYHYSKLAKANHVTINIDCALADLPVGDVDLCCLLGNALNNALEACMRQKEGEKIIRVVSCLQKDCLLLTVDNTYDGKILHDETGILSRKRNTEPGIGIASMQEICAKYDGTCHFKAEDTMFQASFMLTQHPQSYSHS